MRIYAVTKTTLFVSLLAGCVNLPIATPFTQLNPPACEDREQISFQTRDVVDWTSEGHDQEFLSGRIDNVRELDLIVSKTHWSAARICAGVIRTSDDQEFQFRWSILEIYSGLNPVGRGYTGATCIALDAGNCDVTSSLPFDWGLERSL